MWLVGTHGSDSTKSTTHRGAVAHTPRPVEGGLLEKNIAQITLFAPISMEMKNLILCML